MAKLFKWWNYPSMVKFFVITFLTVVLCFLCGYFMPQPWFLLPILIFIIVYRILVKRLFPNVFDDLVKEFKRLMGEGDE